MKNTINPDAFYWATFNTFELRLSGQCVLDCSHSGQCDDDVAYWTPFVLAQIERDDFHNKPTVDKVRHELNEMGAWNDDQLSDDDENWERLIWIAAGNIADSDEPDCSEPVTD